jgi:hypothetical protein
MASVDSSTDRVSTHVIKQAMKEAGYTRLATQLALTRLARMQFVEPSEDSDYNGNSFMVYRMLEAGEDWLLQNQESSNFASLERIHESKPPIRLQAWGLQMTMCLLNRLSP